MGFVDISIAEIAEDCHLSVKALCHICNQPEISYKTSESKLALEDAKAVMLKIIADSQQEAEPAEHL